MTCVIGIDGPPGSGKTTLACESHRQDRRILILPEIREFGQTCLGIDVDAISSQQGPRAGLKATFAIEAARTHKLNSLKRQGADIVLVDKTIAFNIASGLARHVSPASQKPALSQAPRFRSGWFWPQVIVPDAVIFVERDRFKRAHSLRQRGRSEDMIMAEETCSDDYERHMKSAYGMFSCMVETRSFINEAPDMTTATVHFAQMVQDTAEDIGSARRHRIEALIQAEALAYHPL